MDDSFSETDRILVERFVRDKSPEVFREILRRHGGMVKAVCLRILGNDAAAEDAAQATFMAFLKNGTSLRNQEVLGGWLYGVAIRTAKKQKYQSQRRTRLERLAVQPETQKENPDEWGEVRGQLDPALQALPGHLRDVLILRYLEGMTEQQIAQEMDCPRTTVHSRIDTGIKKLRTHLQGWGVQLSSVALVNFLGGQSATTSPQLIASLEAGCLTSAATSVGVQASAAGGLQSALFAKTVGVVSLASAAVLSFVVLMPKEVPGQTTSSNETTVSSKQNSNVLPPFESGWERTVLRDGTEFGDEYEGPLQKVNLKYHFTNLGLAVSSDGSMIYVMDNSNNHCIRKINVGEGYVSKVAGINGMSGYRDGPAQSAMFHFKGSGSAGLAVAPDGTLYIADAKNQCIRVLKEGQVSTLVGAPNREFKDGSLKTAGFERPHQIALRKDGGLVVHERIKNNPMGYFRILEKDTLRTVPLESLGARTSLRRGLFSLDDKGNIYIWDRCDFVDSNLKARYTPGLYRITPEGVRRKIWPMLEDEKDPGLQQAKDFLSFGKMRVDVHWVGENHFYLSVSAKGLYRLKNGLLSSFDVSKGGWSYNISPPKHPKGRIVAVPGGELLYQYHDNAMETNCWIVRIAKNVD